MKKIFLIFIFFIGSAQTHANDLTFEADYSLGFGPAIPVFINDQGPFNFIIDTGATYSLVKKDILKQLNIDMASSLVKSKYTPMQNLDGLIEAKPSELVNINVSGLNFPLRTRLLAFPDKYLSGRIDGVIGLYELRGATLRNDIINKRVLVEYKSELEVCDLADKKSSCYEIEPPTPYQRISNEKITIWGVLDTGNQSLGPPKLSSGSLARSLWQQLDEYNLPVISPAFVGKSSFRSLRLDNLSLFNASGCGTDIIIEKPILPDNAPANQITSTDVSLIFIGWNFLETIPFVINYTDRGKATYELGDECILRPTSSVGILKGEIYFPNLDQGSEEHKLIIKNNGVSLGENRSAASFLVKDILPGSPSWNAGVRHGDYILSLTGPDNQSYSVADNRFFEALREIGKVENDKVSFEVFRNGDIFDATFTTKKSHLVESID